MRKIITSEKVYGFPTKDDLEYFQFQRKRLPLDSINVNLDISGRDYQIEAIRNITENFTNSQREALLVMATGTGKTRTAVSLVDVMMKARWAKRILFLADRKALRDQALGAFKEHLNEPSVWPKPGEYKFAHDRRIYVQTYQSMLKYATGDNQISPHFFDLIISDEAHRSLFHIYKQILDYFDALKVGLTATPREQVHRSSFKLFGCIDDIPTYDYTYSQGVADGHLCDTSSKDAN